MKKRWLYACLCLALMCAFSGCNMNKTSATEPAVDQPTEAMSEAVSQEDAETDSEGENSFLELEVPEYDALEYVELGDYTGLTVDIVKEEVDDEALEMELENMMYDYSQETDIKDGASDEDYVSMTLKLTVGNEVIYEEEEEYSILLGFNEFGEDVDAALLGAKAGDKIELDTTLDDSYGDEYDGKKGHYSIDVITVYRYEVPELTDDFIKENTDYTSLDEYREAKKAELQATNDRNSHYEAEELAIEMVVQNSSFNSYPQELYDYCEAALTQTYQWYADMFGMELEDMISEEEMQSYAVAETCSNMVVQAIAQKENLVLSDELFQKYLEENMEDFGCDTVEEMKEYYADYELRNYAIRSMVGTYILEHSTLNEMDRVAYDEIHNVSEEED